MDELLKKLSKKTALLRVSGLVASFGLAGLISVAVIGISKTAQIYEDRVSFQAVLLSIFFMEFIVLLIRDQIRKDAESLFEEISDELQWGVQGQISIGSESKLKRPDINSRYVLRDFAKNTKLAFGLTTPYYVYISIFCLLIASYMLFSAGTVPLR